MSILDRRLSRRQALVLPVILLTAAGCSPSPLDYAGHTVNSRRDEPTGFKDAVQIPITLRRDADRDKLWQLNDADLDNPDYPWPMRARMTILTSNSMRVRAENQTWRGVVLSNAGRFDVGNIEEKPARDLLDIKTVPPEFRDKATFQIRFGSDEFFTMGKLTTELIKRQAWTTVYLELVNTKNDFQTVPGSRLAFVYKS